MKINHKMIKEEEEDIKQEDLMKQIMKEIFDKL